jgi:flavodoxin
MKTLICYYSHSGNTKKVAQIIAQKTEGTLEEIIDTKNRRGIWGFLSAIFDARFKKPTLILPIKNHPRDFDLVIIGTPVWAGMPSPAIRTYIESFRASLKKVAFFLTYQNSLGNADQELMVLINKTANVLKIKTKELKSQELENKIENFLRELQKD